jgi:hypothetical protein
MEEYKLYKGEITLTFDPRAHIYKANGNVVYGVTSALSVINKPALIFWAVNKAIDSLEKNWNLDKQYDEVEKMKLLEQAKKAHRTYTQDAADIGTLFHNWAEGYVKSKINKTETPKVPKNKQLLSAVQSFLKWEKENNIEWIDSERKLFSKKFQYAGTIDAIAKVNGRLSAIDFKTSSGIYDEMFLQAAAYTKAIEEEHGNEFQDMWIVRVSKTGGDFEAKKTDKIKEHFRGFICALGLYRWQVNRKKEKYENGNI